MLDIELPFPTHMDFVGQKMAERLFQVIIGFFGVIGFIAGYVMQQFSMAVYSVLFGVAVAAFLTLPPWAMFRNNPIQWQKAQDSGKDEATSSKSAKKDSKKSKNRKDD